MSENKNNENYQLSINHYPLIKSSGIDWIGDIPEHWDFKRIKYKITYQKGRNPKEFNFNDKGEPYLTMEYLRGNPKQTYFVEDFQEYLNIENDEILLLWDGSNAGEFIRSRAGILSSTMAALSLDELNKNFTWYYLKTFERILKQATIGMGIPHINGEDFKNNLFLIPTLPEQTAIADYLDEKTAQTDKLIAEKRRLIELFKEERLGVINQAVTRGINPHAKLKPSGIAWLGDIPENWEVKKLKYLVSKVGSGITPSGGANVYLEEGIPLLRSQNIYNEGLVLEDVAFISEEIDEQMSNSRIKDDDVLLNITGASIGRCCYVPKGFERGNVNQHVCIIRPIQSAIETKYLHAFLISGFGQNLVDSCQTGANREGLNFQQIKSFEIPVCDVNEQKQIVEFIETATGKIDATIATIEKEIGFLREYRTALISEVVTGKIKVV